MAIYQPAELIRMAVDETVGVRLGIPVIDDELGGVALGTCGVLGAFDGHGKSSVMLNSAVYSPEMTGIITCEDSPAVVGARMQAYATGINPKKVQRKELSGEEMELVLEASRKANGRFHARICAPDKNNITGVEHGVAQLASQGCKLVWLDYVQQVQVQGVSDDTARVGIVFRRFAEACRMHNVAGMALSQFRRINPQFEEPSNPKTSWLKWSGDMQAGARLILLAWKMGTRLYVKVGKSTHGLSEESTFCYVRGRDGVLHLDRTSLQAGEGEMF